MTTSKEQEYINRDLYQEGYVHGRDDMRAEVEHLQVLIEGLMTANKQLALELRSTLERQA